VTRAALVITTLGALVLGITGCASDPARGYSSASAYPAGISTVAVPIFTNHTYQRDIEFELTDALIKEIEARTPYKVTASGAADGGGSRSAHTVLLGQIRAVQLDQLSKSRLTGLSEEVIVSVTIDFQWRDVRSGRVLLERKGFTGHGLFVPSQPTGEPIELGQFAVVQQLARDVVAEMRAEW
jgi:hypothetical protein